MPKEFVNPNLHVALVHFPIALLIVGTLIEFFSFLWRRHGFRAAGRWMILLGALTSIPVATAGIYALSDVARIGMNPDQADRPWKEVSAASKLNAEQWDLLEDHVKLQSAAAILAVLVCIVWIGCSDQWRSRLYWPMLLILLVSSGLTASGAWHAGEAVYRYGTGVEPGPAGDTAAAAGASAPAVAARSGAAPVLQRATKFDVEYYLPPVQVHVILAGCAVAIALAALGLSIRAITQGPPLAQMDHIAAALGPADTVLGGDAPAEQHDEMAEPADAIRPRVPSARFWLLACLLALLTAAAGAWTLASASESWNPENLWDLTHDAQRRFFHLIAGASIIVLPLILAIVARWTPRAKWTLAIFTVLLLVAVGIQVWLGVLLMYDSSQGPVNAFN